ncbi:MAG: decarboxylating 6-phosphogluconate dehydrogenase [Gammaproteobacteria bacterium]
MDAKEFGLIGLGRMGGNLALQALVKGYKVVGYSKSGASDSLREAGLIAATSLSQLVSALTTPRIIFLYIPAGTAVDELIAALTPLLSPGDILVDGGNSYWGDSILRHHTLKMHGIHFVDLGTSGGVDGAQNGACFMAGGDQAAIDQVQPILLDLAIAGGYVYAGHAGMGHYTKLVHNGIEFGMLQAIGEGITLLKNAPSPAPIQAILNNWCHGSVIRSWLVELMAKAYREDNLDQIPAYVDDTGEVNWLVADALQMEIPIPVTATAVMQLFASRDTHQYANRAIAMMRHQFGGHPFGGPHPDIVKERREGRVNYNPGEKREFK